MTCTLAELHRLLRGTPWCGQAPKRKCGQMERHMSWFFSGLPMLCQRQCIQTWSARSARPPHWLFLMSRRWYGTCLFRQWSGWKCFWDAPWVGAANSTVGTIRHTANLHRTKAPKSRADPRSCGSAANYAAVFSSRSEELHDVRTIRGYKNTILSWPFWKRNARKSSTHTKRGQRLNKIKA